MSVEFDADTDDNCAVYLRALADPIRLRIVRALQSGSLTVSDIAELLEIDIQKVSHHLRILFHAKLLILKREGKFRYYELNPSFHRKRQSIKALDLGCCTIGLRTE
jgi:DNA-binding transcriptional ArsR family regulator